MLEYMENSWCRLLVCYLTDTATNIIRGVIFSESKKEM